MNRTEAPRNVKIVADADIMFAMTCYLSTWKKIVNMLALAAVDVPLTIFSVLLAGIDPWLTLPFLSILCFFDVLMVFSPNTTSITLDFQVKTLRCKTRSVIGTRTFFPDFSIAMVDLLPKQIKLVTYRRQSFVEIHVKDRVTHTIWLSGDKTKAYVLGVLKGKMAGEMR